MTSASYACNSADRGAMAAAETVSPDFASLVETAAGLSVRDQEGQELPFRDIYKEKKAIIVFVRVSNFTVSKQSAPARPELEELGD